MAEQRRGNNRLLYKYAGFGMETLVGLAVAVFLGRFLDDKFGFENPMLVWILPLLVIIAMMVRVIKDTSKSK